MEIFNSTLQQMLMMFFLILVGFFLRKKSRLPDNSHVTMSKLETFVFIPALNLFTQMTGCTAETLSENASLILYGLGLTIAAVLLAYPLSRLLVRNWKDTAEAEYRRNVYKYALTFGNYGFMGNYIMLGVFGDDMFYKYMLFTFCVIVVSNSWGLYVLIPKEQNAGVLQNLKKGFLTPPMISLIVGTVIGLLNLGQYVPAFMLNAFESAGKCQGPVAMVLVGFVIGGYGFRELICNKNVYIASALRLILIPAAMMLVLKVIGASDELMTLALICFAAPSGLNTIVFPTAYGGDPKTGASMATVSHTLSVATIPLMYLLFIVIL